MDVQSKEFEVDYSKLKTDVAFMRVNCITRQELKQELAAMEQRLTDCINGLGRRMDQRFDDVDQRFDDMDKRFDGMDRRLTVNETKLEGLSIRVETELPHLATKGDMSAANARMYAWMVGAILTMTLGFLGLGFTIVNTLKPVTAAVPAATHTRIIPAEVRTAPRLRAA
ncbi:MAG TPA: hypothetical protein VFG03_01590 [Telluria sp.]|nr:hypothetical protein [Telluria sp.]